MTTQSSDEAKVRQKWPEARCFANTARLWIVLAGPGTRRLLGFGYDAIAAWADAARRLESPHE